MKFIKIDTETCQICGKHTDWNDSYGHENFIICPQCMYIAKRKLGRSNIDVLDISCAFGEIRKENKK